MRFIDLGDPASKLPCPACDAPLQVLEVDMLPPFRIERCPRGHGMFFDPAELQSMLDHRAEAASRLDAEMIELVKAGSAPADDGIVYRKCPFCGERMGHLNFGGRSGVILDKCPNHGLWLQAGELHRLAEWWRAGGKLVHQTHEAKRMGELLSGPSPRHRAGTDNRPIDGPRGPSGGWDWIDFLDVIRLLVEAARLFTH